MPRSSPPFRLPRRTDPRACTNCVKAKCRCEPLADSQRCHRCARLNKECVPRASHQRGPDDVSGSQLDGQFSLFDTRLEPYGHPTTNSPLSTGTRASDKGIKTPAATPKASPAAAVVVDQSHHPPWPAFPTNVDADELVRTYKTQLAPRFPFIVVPAGSAADLRRDRPFLLHAICMAASYRNRAAQMEMARAFIEAVSKTLVVHGARDLDAIQGLLVHTAWYHLHAALGTSLSILVQLLLGALASMGLNKPSLPSYRGRIAFDATKPTIGFFSCTREESSESRRTLLGCFFLSSLSSVINRRFETMRYTPYIDACCQYLLEAREFPTDVLAVHQVRMQQMISRAEAAIPFDEAPQPTCSQAPISLHVKALLDEIDRLEGEAPPELKNDGVLSLVTHSTRMFATEVALYSSSWSAFPPAESHRRLDVLHACMRSTAAFFASFAAIPDALLLSTPYQTWGQLSYALLVCSRLTVLRCPGWDGSLVRAEVNLLDALDIMDAKCDAASRLAQEQWLGGRVPDESMQRIKCKAQRIRVWMQRVDAREVDEGVDVGTMEGALGADYFMSEMDGLLWAEFFNI